MGAPSRFGCAYLESEVELTEERERHIADRHPELLPARRERLVETLGDPDQVRTSVRFGSARLFSRWYTDSRRGKHVVVVVISEQEPTERHWIITAYITGKLAGGKVEWMRN